MRKSLFKNINQYNCESAYGNTSVNETN